MNQSFITFQMSPDEFRGMIDEALERKVRPMIEQAVRPPHAPKLLTRKAAALFLGISLPTLHEWTMAGKITANRIGTRVRYYQTDVEAALTQVNTGGRVRL